MRILFLLILFSVVSMPAWVFAQNGKKIKTDIRGPIAKITLPSKQAKQRGILAIVFVDGKRQADTAHDKAYVKITKKTMLRKVVKGKKVAAVLADLKKGMQVEIRFVGPVLESYPVQATAGTVMVLKN